MEIYNYHPEYKHLTAVSIADESPLEPGVYLIPAYATDIKAPQYGESNQIQIFNGTSWEIIEDQRGTYYDIPSGISQENYNPLIAPENATKEQPPEVSEGKVLTWNDGWVLEDIPPPPILTPEEKLANAGLTVDELKILLGINIA
jgi:hypothetical protein